MTRKRWWIVIGMVAVAAAAAVGLSLAFVGGGGGGKSVDTAPVGAGWERVYHESRIGAKQAAVLALERKKHVADLGGEKTESQEIIEFQGVTGRHRADLSHRQAAGLHLLLFHAAPALC